jgi:N-methylhydantoinase B
MGLVLFGKGTRAPMSLGLFGGYPGCNVGYSTFRSANVDDLPGSLDETSGAVREDVFWGHVELEPGDAQYVRFMGGGGYGDPIDRDTALVERDVASGLVSVEAARDIYGVVPRDAAATDRRRLEIRRERLGGRDPLPLAAIGPTGRRISEWLQLASDGSTQCRRCGTAVAPPSADWKEHGVLRRLPVERAGPLRTPAGEFFLVEACCPGCGALLDTDVVLGDDPPLNDRIEDWPG